MEVEKEEEGYKDYGLCRPARDEDWRAVKNFKRRNLIEGYPICKSAMVPAPHYQALENDRSISSEETIQSRPLRSQRNRRKNIEELTLELIEKQEGSNNYAPYETLRRAAEDEDWQNVKKFIEEHPEALTAKLSDSSMTILHYAVNSENIIEFVRELVRKMHPEALELTDMSGMTALSYSAAYGNIEAAEIMINKNPKLPAIEDCNGNLPLHYAARFGKKDMVHFLLSATADLNHLTAKSSVRLVKNLITANLYDIALELLKRYPTLAREKLEDRKKVLKTLSQKPLGFASGSHLGFWQSLIYNCIPDVCSLSDLRGGDVEDPKKSSEDCFTKCTEFGFLQRTCGAMCKELHVMLYNTVKSLVPGIKSIHDTKLMHKQTSELVKLMCEGVAWNFKEALDSLKRPILRAARLGIQEIVHEIMKAYSHSTSFLDDDEHNIFQIAVLHRQEKVFSLVYKMGLGKDWAATFPDKSGNNILHLAGKLAPSSRVSGAALQMQRELQWYKVVENFVHPSLREEENNEKLTPREVFTKEHAELVKAGQEWIKNAATSCSVVAALIITVAFAAAITVPGGNDSQGNPNYLKKMSFSIFAISNALALCFSSASVLMFLGILTSRYSEEDFLFSLPRKIIIGLLTLFLSIAAMMIAFGETLHLLVFNQHKWNNSPLVLLACLPVTLFGLLQIRLLVEMLRSTYGPSFIQPPK